jgi:transcriptional regulator with XRE-family HTH domain
MDLCNKIWYLQATAIRLILLGVETTNAAIGANVLAVRTRRGVSQQDLARHMRARGHKWSQATVWNTESGERNLRLVEAVDLASCLGASVWEISRSVQTAVQLKLAEVTAAAALAEEAMRSYEARRRELMGMSIEGEPEEVVAAYEDESARVLLVGVWEPFEP